MKICYNKAWTKIIRKGEGTDDQEKICSAAHCAAGDDDRSGNHRSCRPCTDRQTYPTGGFPYRCAEENGGYRNLYLWGYRGCEAGGCGQAAGTAGTITEKIWTGEGEGSCQGADIRKCAQSCGTGCTVSVSGYRVAGFHQCIQEHYGRSAAGYRGQWCGGSGYRCAEGQRRVYLQTQCGCGNDVHDRGAEIRTGWQAGLRDRNRRTFTWYRKIKSTQWDPE